MKKVSEELWNLLEDTVESTGLEMLGAEFNAEQGGLLRVYIDSPDGVVIDDCVNVSRQLSAVLDVEDIIPGNYTLEVSSPGVDRPLFRKKDFEKVVGQTVVIRLSMPDIVTGRKKFQGVLDEVLENRIVVLVDNEVFEFDFNDIQKANLKADLKINF